MPIAKIRAFFSVALALAVTGGPAHSADAPAIGPLALTPQELKFEQLPTSPKGLISAIPVGDITKPGMYVLRNQFPPNFNMRPHRHGETRIMTVLEGTLYFGYGDTAPDPAKMHAYGPGSLIIEPKDVWHYFRSGDKGATIQFVAEGPLTTELAPRPAQ